ncbi:DUF927 domain-containing protein [Tatumella sp. JGM130]|uniref:DUF927 domain-containing protein n=1 Tax=Tatumella sp. JGM130 TaxID=2799797 RepID=UPI001BB00EE1|nr:DUF927 domain-containing protein [Tatumella sp. JGM130]MBS0893257.1 DUF927 domain-containing protein [Tatumella sp. JGM130]
MKKTNAEITLTQALPECIKENLTEADNPEITAKKILETIRTSGHSGSVAGLPHGYENYPHELRYTKGDGIMLCSTPVIPYCIYSNESGDGNLGIGLMTINVTGKIVYKHLGLSAFGKDGRGLSELISAGFGLGSGPQPQKYFESFVHKAMRMVLPRVIVTDGMGFSEGYDAFLHGTMPLVRDNTRFVSLVGQGSRNKMIAPLGTHQQWMTLIRENVHGYHQVFALSASLASMLLKPAGMDISMFHFYGGSTTGKTILLQLAMSVHGSGNEPGQKGSNILRWNTTSNALERSLADFSGLVACIDELGAHNNRGFSSTLYNITSGESKIRMDKTLEVRDNFTWNTIILSSGEMSVSEKLSSNKEVLTGGLEHRTISLEVMPEDSRSLLAEDEDVSMEALIGWADTLKSGLSEYYGTAGKLFISHFLTQKDDNGVLLPADNIRQQLHQMITDETESFISQLEESDDDDDDKAISLSAIQKRAMKRFALVSVAGKLAVQWGILPFTEEQIEESVLMLAYHWQNNTQSRYDPETSFMTALRTWLLNNLHVQFSTLGIKDDLLVSSRSGFLDAKTTDILIYKDAFSALCAKHNMSVAQGAKALCDNGYLTPESEGHFKKRKRRGMEQDYYHIHRSFMNSDFS